MFRMLAVTVLVFMSGTVLLADEPPALKLAAPEEWGGETIQLPPTFARDMQLKGLEHIRFAPGMMKPASDSFFSYAFVFELQTEPVLTEDVVREEFLKYYRGLCKTVLNGKIPEVNPAEFKLELEVVKTKAPPAPEGKSPNSPFLYTGKLDWVEPFVTKKRQTLNLEVRTWVQQDRNYIFVCVSSLPRDAAIWKQLRAIRDDYLKSQPQEK